MRPLLRRMAGASAALLIATAVVSPAHADENSWTSLYEGTAYEGAGWASCPEPIRVSVDTRELAPDQRAKAERALRLAITTWNRGGYYTFAYGGEVPVRFDRATGVSVPEDGVARDRWIYVTLVKATKQETRDTAVVGLAGPLRVDPATKSILEASAAFQAQYVNKQSRNRVAILFAHELGHAAGLGHSTSKQDVMYPILSDLKRLGPGDIAGGVALVRPCPVPPAPPAVPPAPEPAPAG